MKVNSFSWPTASSSLRRLHSSEYQFSHSSTNVSAGVKVYVWNGNCKYLLRPDTQRELLTLNSMLCPANAPNINLGLSSLTSKVSQLKRTVADSQQLSQSFESGEGLMRSLYHVISPVSSKRNLILSNGIGCEK